MNNRLRPKDYDIIFLSYDEPNADKNYHDLLTKVPWAKRVHGVEGSDAAHKACADLSETDRFITVDADNIVDPTFINQDLVFQDHVDLANSVVSWSGKNIINGLTYGNGGIKCWPKHIVRGMKTHENADPNNAAAQVDFCWDIKYCQVDKIYSYVHNNATTQQAWRAGFREGVKMTLNEGVKVDHENFLKQVHKKNMDRLRIWQTVGLDVDNGIWAMYGARLGTYLTNCTDWDYVNVRDFEYVNKMWHDTYSKMDEEDLLYEMEILGKKLGDELGMSIPLEVYNEEQSKFFKSMYVNPPRIGKTFIKEDRSLYDIVMITYNEPNGDENFQKLQQRFPRAKRVHGIKGIHNAHIEAAKQVSSDLFWVVDGDAVIHDDFMFDYVAPHNEKDYVKVWRSINPVNGLEYGYGGVKLLPRALTEHMDTSKPDMTTSISSKFKPMPVVSNYTDFAVDEFTAWRSAFRECCKLSSKVIDRQKSGETDERLETWCTHAEGKFADVVLQGANAGVMYGTANKFNKDNLAKINDFDWLLTQFESRNNLAITLETVTDDHIPLNNITESTDKIRDILDRFEFLYGGDLEHVRRMYNDNDLSSIFKLTDNDELRKAVIEENIHSIFRLVETDDDIRKAIVEKNVYSLSRLLPSLDNEFKLSLSQNINSLWRVLEKYTNSSLITPLKKLVDNPDFDIDCISRGQLESKKWLVDELKNIDNLVLGKVCLCAGWYATVVPLLVEADIEFDLIRSFDLDPSVWKIAEAFNKDLLIDGWKFKAQTADINELDFSVTKFETERDDGTAQPLKERFNTIVNTSCEHIEGFDSWYNKIPASKLVILQSNNYFEIDEHVNCSESLEAFAKQTPMSQVLYQGELELEKYTRYMRIGHK
jgi:peptidyl-tRNA hydrolase